METTTTEEIDDDLLREALRPFRPDAERFDAAVREKIEHGAARPMSRAAGVVPFPFAMDQVSLPWLSLPVVSTGALAAAFVTSVRRVVRLTPSSDASEPNESVVDDTVREWWHENALASLLAIALVIVLAWTVPAEAVLAALCVSMLSVGSVLSKLAASGLASRASAGRFCANFLGLMVVGGLFAGDTGSGLRGGFAPNVWILITLLFGAFLCDFAGRWRADQSAVATARGLLPTLVLAMLAFGVIGPRAGTLDRGDVRDWLQRFDAPMNDVVEWKRFGDVARSLEGTSMLDLGNARRRADNALDDFHRVSSHTWSGALNAGVAPDDVRSRILDEPRTRGLVDGTTVSAQHVSVHHHRLLALVESDMTEDERAALTAWLGSSLPEAKATDALSEVAIVADLLDRLDAPLEDDLRDRAHAALSAHWLGDRDDSPAAGFSGLNVRSSPSPRSPLHVSASHAAVRLIDRFGAPDDVDLQRLDLYLERMSTPSLTELLAPRSLDLLTVQPYRYEAAVARERLRSSEAWKEATKDSHGPAPWWIRERLVIGAILLSSLSLFAVVRLGR